MKNLKRFIKIMKLGVKAEKDVFQFGVLSLALGVGSIAFMIYICYEASKYGVTEDATALFITIPAGIIFGVKCMVDVYRSGKEVNKQRRIKYLRRKKARKNQKQA